LLAWQRGLGTTAGATRGQGDADADGDVDASDLAQWRSNFGSGDALAATAASATAPAMEAALASSESLIALGSASHWRSTLADDVGSDFYAASGDPGVLAAPNRTPADVAARDLLDQDAWRVWQTRLSDIAAANESIDDLTALKDSNRHEAFERAVDATFAGWR
ncbi:MAG TPA: hypothetical protein VF175_17665, partial [Lacipirellula sp.]